jgi:tetratricopeptide (TPR) repeat protein
MQLRRKRRKALLHAKHEAEAAWQSLEDGDLLLADRQITRAVAAAEHSAPMWTDYARILVCLGKLQEAEKAARNALVLDRDYAEAHTGMAEVFASMGHFMEAHRSQARAVRLQPGLFLYRELLAQYEAALPVDEEDFPVSAE